MDNIRLHLENYLPFFDKLSENEKNKVIKNASIKTVNTHELIHSKNSDCTGIVLVLKGQLRSFMISDSGREITIFRLFERDVCILSSSCFYKNLTYDINLEAYEKSTIIIIDGNLIKELSYKNLCVQEFIINLTQNKLSETLFVLEQVVFFSLKSRVANFLLNEYYLTNSLDINITHDYIANNLGSSREVISRMLKGFEKEGIISIFRGKLTILDLKMLKNIC